MKIFSIGVLDSGVGGIYVLGELVKRYKNFNFIYLGDNKNTPYGNKSIDELEALFDANVNVLLKHKVDMIVVACNTLSTNFYKTFYKYKIQIITILQPVIENSYLLCTKATFTSDYFSKNFKGNAYFLINFAKEIESNIFRLESVDVTKLKTIVPSNVNNVILGCTHYLYLKDKIAYLLDKNIYTGIDGVFEKIDANLLNLKACKNKFLQKIKFVGSSKRYNKRVFTKFFGSVVKKIKKN